MPIRFDDVLDVIDVMIERRLFLARTDEDGIHTDDTAAFAHHFDLVVADVALDVVSTFARWCVRQLPALS